MTHCLICNDNIPEHIVKRVGGYAIVKCQNCRSYFAVPDSRNLEQDASHFYDSREYLVGRYSSWAHHDFLAYKPVLGGTLLDIGSGTGDFLHYARLNGYHVLGIDHDSRAVKMGNNYWEFDSLVCCDALAYLGKTQSKWDAITLFGVLEHFPDPNPLFQQIVDHLQPNGVVSITVQNMDSFCSHLWAKLTLGNDYPPNHYTRWSEKGLELFLARYGFKVLFRTTCQPDLWDILFDVVGEVFAKRKRLLLLSLWLVGAVGSVRLVRLLEKLLLHRIKEGRGQMVIASRA